MSDKTATNSQHTIARRRAQWVAKAGILTAAAVVLMYLELSLPFMPVFLMFDFSEVVVLIAAFSMGPLTGILVELAKNLLHLPATHTGGVGELANFIIGSSFVGTAGLIYQHMKSRRGAFIAMGSGTLIMTALASLINYFFLIPFYIRVMGFPLPAIINMANQAGNTFVTDLKTLIFFVFVPFNLFKGIVVSLIVALIYKRISPLLHR
jgi:riboflavin transporter FmnP